MKKVWTPILVECGAIAVLLVGGAFLLVSKYAEAMCDYETVRSSTSEDGRYIADVTFRDCGRDLGFYYLISLRRSSIEQRLGEPQEVVVGAYFNDLDGRPFWEGQRLIIPYAHRVPNLQRERWRDVRIAIRNVPDIEQHPTR